MKSSMPLLPRLATLFGMLFILMLPARLTAIVSPAAIFQDQAVLQRDVLLPVWGLAAPGEKVTVQFAGQTRSTWADANGRWRVMLDPLPASCEARTLVIEGENVVRISDIVVGEVWLASGQSNMEWNVNNSHDADLERLTARFPLIRELKVAKTTATAPADTVKAAWKPASPDSVGSFSAVAYHFAREVHLALNGVPVGILNSSWGGTPIEAWMSAQMLAAAEDDQCHADREAEVHRNLAEDVPAVVRREEAVRQQAQGEHHEGEREQRAEAGEEGFVIGGGHVRKRGRRHGRATRRRARARAWPRRA
jgi:sialate O-acetylesterase